MLDRSMVEALGGAGNLAESVMTASHFSMSSLSLSSGLAPIVETGLTGSEWEVVTEWEVTTGTAPGQTLHSLVSHSGPMCGDAVLRLATDTAASLVALHDAGLAHGGVHPRTVVLGPNDVWLVGGLLPAGPQPFGPAIPTEAQLDDVRAWAATIGYAATGRETFLELTTRDSGGWLDPQGPAGPDTLAMLPPPLAALLRSCLVTDPVHRPTARQMLDHLRNSLDHLRNSKAPVPAPTGRDSPRLPTARRDHAAPDPAELAIFNTPVQQVGGLTPRARGAARRHRSERRFRPFATRRRAVVTGVAGALSGCLLGAGAVSAAVSVARPDTKSQTTGSRAALSDSGPGDSARPVPVLERGTCTARLEIVEAWPGGFKAEIIVIAGATAPVDGWRVSWSLVRRQSVRQWWNADIRATGPRIVAQSIEANRQLPAGSRTTFGLVVDGPNQRPAGAVGCTVP